MPSFFRRRKLIVLLTGLIIIVALIGYSMRTESNTNIVSELVLDTVGFFQNIIYTPINLVMDVIEDIDDVQDVYEQNELLKNELQQFKTQAFQLNDLKRENKDLQALADIEESLSDYSQVKATVIARSPERWFDHVTINKGEQHGIKRNMAVTNGEGMVGKVIEVSQLTSTVQLLSGFDEQNRISVEVDQEEPIFGLIEGYDEESESLIFRDLENEDDIEKGQTIVSSGMGGVFPKGLLIGTVERVEMDQYGLTKIAYVKPAANLYDINHLMVVDRDLHSPVIDEEEE